MDASGVKMDVMVFVQIIKNVNMVLKDNEVKERVMSNLNMPETSILSSNIYYLVTKTN